MLSDTAEFPSYFVPIFMYLFSRKFINSNMCSHVLNANAEGMCARNLTCFAVNISKVPQVKYICLLNKGRNAEKTLT